MMMMMMMMTSRVLVGVLQIQGRVRVIRHEHRSRQNFRHLVRHRQDGCPRSPWRCDRACQAAQVRHLHAGLKLAN